MMSSSWQSSSSSSLHISEPMFITEDSLRHFTKAFADSRHGFYKLFAAKCAYPKGVKSVFGCMIQFVGYHFSLRMITGHKIIILLCCDIVNIITKILLICKQIVMYQ